MIDTQNVTNPLKLQIISLKFPTPLYQLFE